jgi:hypothetical protein
MSSWRWKNPLRSNRNKHDIAYYSCVYKLFYFHVEKKKTAIVYEAPNSIVIVIAPKKYKHDVLDIFRKLMKKGSLLEATVLGE